MGSSVAALTVVAYAALAVHAFVTLVPPQDGESYLGGALWMLSWVPFGLVGGLLIARRPDHPVGWLLAGICAPIFVTVLLDAVAAEAVTRGWEGAWVGWVAWVAGWIYAPLVPLLGLLLASFPAGRIRHRLLARLAPIQYATIVAIAVLRMLRPGPTDTQAIPSPVDVGISRVTIDALVPWVTGFAVVYGIVAGIDLVVRYVRARGAERAQLKWLAASIGFFIGAFVLLLIVAEPFLADALGEVAGEIVGNLVFTIGLGGMASAIGIAVLRYRLFEIDRIVSRTVTYAAVVAVLVAIYLVGVVGLGRLIAPVTGESDLAVAGATLVVAALFRPVQRRLRAAIDRRFDRSRYDAAIAAEAFGTRLRDEVELRAVATDLRAVVAETLAPRTVSLWLRDHR